MRKGSHHEDTKDAKKTRNVIMLMPFLLTLCLVGRIRFLSLLLSGDSADLM